MAEKFLKSLKFPGLDNIYKIPSTADDVGARPSDWMPTAEDVGAAPNGYGYGGVAVHLGSVTTEEELNTALESVYSGMIKYETKMVSWYGYPSQQYNWFGILSKSSDNYGSLVANSSYTGGVIYSKTKTGGTWQALKCENPNSLRHIGISTFPTTMSVIANSMPKNSMLVLDSRLIISGGDEEISDLGLSNAGMYIFFRGTSNARLSLLNIYGATSATTSYMNYGCYAATNNAVVWIRGERQNTTYPDCRYRTASDGETEWINPPMLPGVEYRTTERVNGRPVYCYLFNYGYYATGSEVTAIQHNLSIYQPISIDVTNNIQEILTNSSGVTDLSFNRTYVYLKCNWNMGNVHFIMKYTK